MLKWLIVPIVLSFCGCVWHPMVHHVYLRPDIEQEQQRTLSVQMTVPSARWPEFLLSSRQLDPGDWQEVPEDPSDFVVGYATPKELSHGLIKLEVREGYERRVLEVPPHVSAGVVVALRLVVPLRVGDASVQWIDAEP